MEPSKKPIIFVASMARAGSMWTFNATRDLLRESGYEVLPEKVPVVAAPLLKELKSFDPGPGKIYCFKTHQHISPMSPLMRVISPYRDIRDAILSMQKFIKCSFQQALEHAKLQMDTVDYYHSKDRKLVLPLRYEEITGSPDKALRRIADFLRLEVAEETINEIVTRYSKSNVENLLSKLENVEIAADGAVVAAEEETKEQYQAVPNIDTTYRVFDSRTGFQSNHITSGKSGAWRTELSEEEQARMMEVVTPWLEKHGFEL
jgi:hypothetical protein